MSGNGPHYPQYSYDIIRKLSLMIYSGFREYKMVGDTKILLLRCNLLISKSKNWRRSHYINELSVLYEPTIGIVLKKLYP